MSRTEIMSPRSFAFGSPSDGVWGAAWLAGAGDPRVAIGTGIDVRVCPTTVAAAADEGWSVQGDGLELTLSPLGPTGHSFAPQNEALDQLCRVEGSLEVAGRPHQVDAVGWRALGGAGLSGKPPESVRQLAAWFGPGEGLALLAVRPHGARGQEGDVISAVVFEPEAAIPVADPRLSTTYTEGGTPHRAGLELWIGEEEEHQHSRRAAGEAVGAAASWREDGLDLEALPFRWHLGSRDGAGVYLLGRSA